MLSPHCLPLLRPPEEICKSQLQANLSSLILASDSAVPPSASHSASWRGSSARRRSSILSEGGSWGLFALSELFTLEAKYLPSDSHTAINYPQSALLGGVMAAKCHPGFALGAAWELRPLREAAVYGASYHRQLGHAGKAGVTLGVGTQLPSVVGDTCYRHDRSICSTCQILSQGEII